jgi:energy-coupling factor transporter ATP-binding protein EcfA2
VIKTFHARNYGCLVDVNAALTPLHAFIGPNDSGKSTLLHGMRTVVQLASGDFSVSGGKWGPFDPFLPSRLGEEGPASEPVLLGCGVEGGWYSYAVGAEGPEERASSAASTEPFGKGPCISQPRGLSSDETPLWYRAEGSHDKVFPQLASARLVRFDPDALRKPSGLIPDVQSVGFVDERGFGLPGVYFALRNLGDDVFPSIIDDVRKHFQTIKGLRVKAVTSSTVELEAELRNGARVGADRMSEGLLYYLAFAALRHLQPTSLLLVEEPENGLHPARIAEVVKILRTIVKETGTQVVMATHSPLVVNELQPEEVSVVTRTDEAGTRITPITETHNFEKRSSIYALGELWLSYANGVDEEPLIHGREVP